MGLLQNLICNCAVDGVNRSNLAERRGLRKEPFLHHCRVNMVARFVSAFPELSPTYGGREHVQHVPLFQISALQVAQGNTVQQNE